MEQGQAQHAADNPMNQMEEKFTLNREKAVIRPNAPKHSRRFFQVCSRERNTFRPALRMRYTTQTRMPWKA